MARVKAWNPLAFKPIPVSIITVVTYIALFAGLLYVHHVVPPAPKESKPVPRIDIDEAWKDLATLTEGYHPFNSHQNDVVRSWLLQRIEEILNDNNVEFVTESTPFSGLSEAAIANKDVPVILFNDMVSNSTFSGTGHLSVYFEGTNIIIYIRGSEDGDSALPKIHGDQLETAPYAKDNGRGVLVNAHYDSVSTGFGATDDGVGVVSILQLIRYFTTSGNQPKRGLVALLNNGEEDFLNGAHAFMQHPISKFPDTFLNLEGAGAGGRAILFRSTDSEVTAHYKKSPYPFGSVLADDGFNKGLIRSETDYVVFNGALGMRGLDVAFMEPRARYHTAEDSARRTSKDSLWHMLSAALATTRSLSSDTDTKYGSDTGSPGVWFDLFGRAFGLTNIQTMFAISVTLLVVAPLTMIGMLFLLQHFDRMYIFASKTHSDSLDPHSPDEEVVVHISGWRGLFRFPVAFVLASAAVVGLAFLVAKINPLIVYSSPYAVWSMLLSAWFIVAWFILRGADFMRPTALQRAHSLSWLLGICWIVLVADTIALRNFQIAGGYFWVIYFAGVFLATLICFAELFRLPKKREYVTIASRIDDNNQSGSNTHRPASRGSSQLLASDVDDRQSSSDRLRRSQDREPTERTGLLSGSAFKTRKFGKYSVRRHISEEDESPENQDQSENVLRIPYGEEQSWSGTLPNWLWVVEFLVLAPMSIILVGQVGLLAVSALYQTGADGSPVLVVHLALAIVSIFLLMPISPFLHRFSNRIPTLLFLVFIGTLIYNLLAFPFSEQNRLKVYFDQEVDLDSGVNRVTLTGVELYVREIANSLPSASGQKVKCDTSVGSKKNGLRSCGWEGLAPDIASASFKGKKDVSDPVKPVPPEKDYSTWVTFKAERVNGTSNEAILFLSGKNTRACRLFFDMPVTRFQVKGASTSPNEPTPAVPKGGVNEIRLWSRDWNRGWTVHAKWEGVDWEPRGDIKGRKDKPAGVDGRAVCIWSDDNESGVIPALDEVRRFMPVWAQVSKVADGLVEGSKRIMI